MAVDAWCVDYNTRSMSASQHSFVYNMPWLVNRNESLVEGATTTTTANLLVEYDRRLCCVLKWRGGCWDNRVSGMAARERDKRRVARGRGKQKEKEMKIHQQK